VELNSKVPARHERNKARKSRSKSLPLISVLFPRAAGIEALERFEPFGWAQDKLRVSD
jgi:hypothetical protein